MLLGVASFVALSPLLVDLARHLGAEPWARYAALFGPLLLWAAWSDPLRSPPRADGLLWLAAGVALAFVAVGGGMPRLGRPAIPLAVVGLARLLGRPSPARALLALWIVPVPTVLTRAAPQLQIALGELVERWAGGLRLERAGDHVSLVAAQGALPLLPSDGGIPLAALLAGLAWYGAARRGGSLAQAAGQALRWAPWALPIQVLALALAVGLLQIGQPAAARAWLDHGVWALVAAVGLARLHGAWRPKRAQARLR